MLTDDEKLLAVREYLRRVGEIPDSMLAGGYDTLVGYLQVRLHQVASSSLFSLFVCWLLLFFFDVIVVVSVVFILSS